MELTKVRQKYIGGVSGFIMVAKLEYIQLSTIIYRKLFIQMDSIIIQQTVLILMREKGVNSMKLDVMRMCTVSSKEVISTTLQNLDKEAQSFLPALLGLSPNIRNWRQQSL